MPRAPRLALCQSNPVVGDLAGNVAALQARIGEARERGADVVLFPELSITGYPPEDLLLKPSFVQDAAAALSDLAAGVTGIVACVGVPADGAAFSAGTSLDGGRTSPAGTGLHNSAAVLADGRVAAVHHKHHLPNYAVFDERRYFEPGDRALVIDLDGHRLGVTICEDIWAPGGPTEWSVLDGGAEVILNLSASPYHRGKGRERERLFAARCRDHRCFLAFCNAVGGQDELVFDGHSLVIGPDGSILARGAPFEEEMLVVEIDPTVAGELRRSDPRWSTSPPASTAGRTPAPVTPRDASRVSVVPLQRPGAPEHPPLFPFYPLRAPRTGK